MKKTLLAAASLLILATACKKNDDNNSTPSNTWKLGANSYTAGTVLKQTSSNSVNAAANSGNAIYFHFTGLPTANGTYKVVGTATAANEVEVFTLNSNLDSYESTGNSNTNVAVTVSNGKINISLPETWVMNAASSTDSLKLSANITEQ